MLLNHLKTTKIGTCGSKVGKNLQFIGKNELAFEFGIPAIVQKTEKINAKI